MSTTHWIEALVTIGMSVLVGAVELASRYRDDPWQAVRTKPGAMYMFVNAFAAGGALYLTYAFSVFPDETARSTVLRVLLAGIGAMAFFRTSLFNVRVGDQDVVVGPGT